jgi:hypothetical protein
MIGGVGAMDVSVKNIQNEGTETFLVTLEITRSPFGPMQISTRVEASTFSEAAEKARETLFRFASDLAKASEHPDSFG